MAERRGWSRRRWTIGTGAALAAAVVAGVLIWATAASGSGGYRTAEVNTASVQSLLGVSGTAQPDDQSTVNFQVSGTVAQVNVALGQQVTAGETLASLDPTSLQRQVTAAQSTLNAANATLTSDESGQASGTDPRSSSGTTGSGSTASATTTTTPSSGSGATAAQARGGGTGTSPGAGSGGGSGAATTLQSAQQAVVGSQQTADTDQQTAAADLANAQTACGGSHTTPKPTPGHGSGGAPSTYATGASGTNPTIGTTTKPTKPTGPTKPTTTKPTTTKPTTTSASSAACTTALDQALAAEQKVATDQKAVASAETSLAQLLASEASSAATSANGSSGSSGSSGSPSSSAAHAGSSATGSTTSEATVSAAQLATDQATIDSDEGSLIDAQQSLDSAQLTSPISGTVVAVDLSAGQSVTAGSTSDVITVIDRDSYDATASLTSSQVPQVKVGDMATVAVDGSTGTLTGTVARVGPVDTSGSDGDTYPIVVALPAGAHGIFAGSSAQIEVVLRKVHDAVAVPTSAVHSLSAGTSYVLVLQSGQQTRKTVHVGVVGDLFTQITSGLSPGQTVVLADLTEPVPTSSTNTFASRFTSGGLGSFTGGGAGPGIAFRGGTGIGG